MRLTISGKINQKAGDDTLMNMIILDMQPIRIVENDGFKKYSRILNSDYVLPSRKVLTRMLLEVKQMNLDVITLLQDIPTRWNFTFYMLEKLLRVKVALCAALPLIDSPPPNLSFAEKAILEDCVKILQPLEIVTKTLSGEFYSTLSSVIPIIQGVKNSINKRTPTTNTGKNLLQNLLRNISQRFGYLENDEITAKATILDPRYKKKAFGLESSADKAMALVLDEVKEMTTAEHIEKAESFIGDPYSERNCLLDSDIYRNIFYL
ncbi:zinc finger BED domain-containing protein 4-like [Ctenocephalides felis]|uniref:zinc finger BED domain-containing protein 4-like n=1 Tax=Ctenocephalides felis TaxID=7515 RepID=UPI000E6E3470|nr:zinc finger BED domain-containing protein 4-like [Ctenocephalides felis]